MDPDFFDIDRKTTEGGGQGPGSTWTWCGNSSHSQSPGPQGPPQRPGLHGAGSEPRATCGKTSHGETQMLRRGVSAKAHLCRRHDGHTCSLQNTLPRLYFIPRCRWQREVPPCPMTSHSLPVNRAVGTGPGKLVV